MHRYMRETIQYILFKVSTGFKEKFDKEILQFANPTEFTCWTNMLIVT